MLSFLAAAVPSAITTNAACTPSGTTIYLKWNMFNSEWGGYEITGCTGVNPTLSLAAGTTYTFDQSDASNWYHPVGFSYIAGGAHQECAGNTPAGTGTGDGTCPELGGESPTSTIQYHVDGIAVTSDDSGFGLDAYEPLFFNSQDWWGEQNAANAYRVTLTIPTTATYTKIYYFCHIHAGMSAEITITGSAGGNVLNPSVLMDETQTSALAKFDSIVAAEQVAVGSADEACGTYNVFSSDSYSTCSNSHFLCGAGSTGAYETCLKAVDCKMHHDMAVSVPSGSSRFATFARQMIPHHQNAVAMAKVLAKHHTSTDYPAPGTEDADMDWANGLIRNIINVQNRQIQQMDAWLSGQASLAGSSSNCYAGSSGISTGVLIAIIAAAAVGLLVVAAIVKTASPKREKKPTKPAVSTAEA